MDIEKQQVGLSHELCQACVIGYKKFPYSPSSNLHLKSYI
jgi:hypothetical protein